LAISRGIVEAHGGRIWVESECCDEKRMPGSTFFIELPLDTTLPGRARRAFI
jgi:signal transduction histidine kinase